MDQSILSRLPLEIQGMIILYAFLVKQPECYHLPLDFTSLQICRQLRTLGLDVLRREFQWIHWTIYRCVGSSFLNDDSSRRFEKYTPMLQNNTVALNRCLAFVACACRSGRMRHSMDVFTTIILPFEHRTFAEMCLQIMSDLKLQVNHIHLTLDLMDNGIITNDVIDLIKLQLRGVILRSTNQSVVVSRQIQWLIDTKSVNVPMIMGAFRNSLDEACHAIHEGLPHRVLDEFLHLSHNFPHCQIMKLCRTPGAVNNTIGILYASMGRATMQAIYQAVKREMRFPLSFLNEVRSLAKRAALFHIALTDEERRDGYLWDIAVIRMLANTIDRNDPLQFALLVEAAKSYWGASSTRTSKPLPRAIRQELVRLSVLEYAAAPLSTLSLSDGSSWTGPMEVYQMWNQWPGYLKEHWWQLKARKQDVIDSVREYAAEDPLMIILSTIPEADPS